VWLALAASHRVYPVDAYRVSRYREAVGVRVKTDGVSPGQIAEYAIRQPLIAALGEARYFKDVCCDLAQRLGFPLGFDSAEKFVEAACKLTPIVKKKARPWRIANSICYRQLKQTATMALPTKSVQIDGLRLSTHWNAAIQPTMRAVIVKILLITEKLPLQICGRPNESS